MNGLEGERTFFTWLVEALRDILTECGHCILAGMQLASVACAVSTSPLQGTAGKVFCELSLFFTFFIKKTTDGTQERRHASEQGSVGLSRGTALLQTRHRTLGISLCLL